jgi:hypothetical protein
LAADPAIIGKNQFEQGRRDAGKRRGQPGGQKMRSNTAATREDPPPDVNISVYTNLPGVALTLLCYY